MAKNSGDHASFWKILRGHVRTVLRNTHVKYEVRSFSRFGAIKSLFTTNTQTMILLSSDIVSIIT